MISFLFHAVGLDFYLVPKTKEYNELWVYGYSPSEYPAPQFQVAILRDCWLLDDQREPFISAPTEVKDTLLSYIKLLQ